MRVMLLFVYKITNRKWNVRYLYIRNHYLLFHTWVLEPYGFESIGDPTIHESGIIITYMYTITQTQSGPEPRSKYYCVLRCLIVENMLGAFVSSKACKIQIIRCIVIIF